MTVLRTFAEGRLPERSSSASFRKLLRVVSSSALAREERRASSAYRRITKRSTRGATNWRATGGSGGRGTAASVPLPRSRQDAAHEVVKPAAAARPRGVAFLGVGRGEVVRALAHQALNLQSDASSQHQRASVLRCRGRSIAAAASAHVCRSTAEKSMSSSGGSWEGGPTSGLRRSARTSRG